MCNIFVFFLQSSQSSRSPFQAYNMFLSVKDAEDVKQYLAGVGSRGLITRNAGLAVTKIRLDKPPDST